MLDNYYAQRFLPPTRDILTEELHSVTLESWSYLSNVMRLAHAKGSTFRTRTAGYAKTSTPTRVPRRPLMHIGNSLTFRGEQLKMKRRYSSKNDKTDTLLLMPLTARGSPISSRARSFTSYDGIDIIDISGKLEQMIPVKIPQWAETQARCALVMIPFGVGNVARWLCRNPHLLYRCLYLTLEQQLSTVYLNYAYHTRSKPNLRNLSEQRAMAVDPTSYLARLQKSKPTETTGSFTHLTVPQSPTEVSRESLQPRRNFENLRVLRSPTQAENGQKTGLSRGQERIQNRKLREQLHEATLLMKHAPPKIPRK